MRRVALSLACALLVVLAGCSLGPGSQQPTPTITPAEVTAPPIKAGPGDADATRPSEDAGTSSPGADLQLEVGARIDVHALVDAHARTLNDTSHTLRIDQGVGPQFVRVGSNGLIRIGQRPEGGAVLSTRRSFARHQEGPVTRTLARPRTRPIPDGSDLLGQLGGSLMVTETVRQDGERRYVLRTDQQTSTPPDQPRRYVRVVAGERGVVHNHTFGTVIPDEGVAVLDTFTVSEVGSTTVDAPTWVESVRDAPVDADSGTGTVVVTHDDLGATLRVTADANSLRDVDLRLNENDFVTSEFVERASASTLVTPSVSAPVENATIRSAYDPAELPDGATEQNLTLAVYNSSLQTYLPLNTSVDTAANTAVATEAPPVTYSSGGGPEQTMRPVIVGPGSNSVVVVMHFPTFLEAFEQN
jgi:hypothetical protein